MALSVLAHTGTGAAVNISSGDTVYVWGFDMSTHLGTGTVILDTTTTWEATAAGDNLMLHKPVGPVTTVNVPLGEVVYLYYSKEAV